FNRIFRGGGGDSVDSAGACTSCQAYDGCGGGCPAVKHAVTGRLDLPDPDCVLETALRGRPAGVLAIDDQPLCAG
ncbi:MAG: hypothetical protein V3S64_09385, partial [bacterium]